MVWIEACIEAVKSGIDSNDSCVDVEKKGNENVAHSKVFD